MKYKDIKVNIKMYYVVKNIKIYFKSNVVFICVKLVWIYYINIVI